MSLQLDISSLYYFSVRSSVIGRGCGVSLSSIRCIVNICIYQDELNMITQSKACDGYGPKSRTSLSLPLYITFLLAGGRQYELIRLKRNRTDKSSLERPAKGCL